MPCLRKIAAVACLALASLALGGSVPALGFDSGVRTPVLANSSPGAVSVPFEIPIRQFGAIPQPFHFLIAVEGFALDPEPVQGRRIGSLDFLTDSGKFGNKAIYSDGPGLNGVRTWTLDWQLSGENEPIVATIEDGVGLDMSGQRIEDPGFTSIGFTMPGNYHGFPVTGLSFRLNQDERGRLSAGTGAVNPDRPGSYRITSRVVSAAPENLVSVKSAWARVGLPALKTSLAIKAKKRVRPGRQIRFRLHTTNETRDRVEVRLGGRRLRSLQVGPEARYVWWRPNRGFKGRRVVLRFKPANGPARKVAVKVNRR